MEMKLSTGIAVIGDVVGSRAHINRTTMQRQLVAALDTVNAAVRAQQPLQPTIGDEFQAVYADVATAVAATLRLRLGLPDGLDCRFGLGAGDFATVGHSQYGVMQDGSAWWSARDAIVIAKDRESRRNKTLRTWFCRAEGESDDGSSEAGFVNGLLLCQDHLVSSMASRQRRLLLGLLDAKTQSALAAAEGISPSAVSQSLYSSGAYAVLAAQEQLRVGAP